MKLLLDANISWRLTAKLKPHFTDCFHVDHIGLTVPAKDVEIWDYALLNDLIIVTNDNDFLNLADVKGFPPRLILLTTGNQSNQFIEELMTKHKEDIEALSKSDEYGFLEIF
jgi:predicted nuclease of predicted toxin-antitoxin system